jgi:hypothetical protein
MKLKLKLFGFQPRIGFITAGRTAALLFCLIAVDFRAASEFDLSISPEFSNPFFNCVERNFLIFRYFWNSAAGIAEIKRV